jgi:beta-lactamase class A
MRIPKLLMAVIIIAVLMFGLRAAWHAKQQHDERVRAVAAAKAKAEAEAAAQKRLDTLQGTLNDMIAASDISTSVSVIDLDYNRSTQAGLNVIFRAASTNKVLSVAAYMHEVEAGRATLDTLVSGVRARSLIERMLRNSDNTAWAAINAYLGEDTLTGYATSIGITSYGAANNTITSNDMALLFQKLYQRKLMNATHTELILSFMQHTNNEDLIPAALPDGATVYHKFGLYEGELHDAAIVSYRGHSFALVIFTNNERTTLGNYTSRMQLIHELTTATVEAVTASGAGSGKS